MGDGEIVKISDVEMIPASDVPNLLQQIRPAWQAKNLIHRVRSLIPVDPSSACQRIFNAAIHDLREKVVIAGLDIARDAAKQHRLPSVERAEDIERYNVSALIDLVYGMGLLSRPEWRRLCRVYDIRRDLEHEDDEYQATVEDCIYIFKTCIEIVLSRDPIHLLRVTDVKSLVEQALPVVPTSDLLTDYEHAPQPRQEEICRFLISTSLDSGKPDIVRQNAFQMIQHLSAITQNAVKLILAAHIPERLGRKPLDLLHARVAVAAGVFAYLKQSQRNDYFETVASELNKIGYTFRSHDKHGEPLRNLQEVGGLLFCPPPARAKILLWLVLAYIGEPGGYGAGYNRPVFYSNAAEPIINQLLADAASQIQQELRALESDREVKAACGNPHIARRFQNLLDLVETRREESPSRSAQA